MVKQSCLKGFTLIELVIVIAILGILMGFAAPVINQTVEKHGVAAYAREFAGDIRFVRHRNINGESTVKIQLLGDKYVIRKGTVVLETKNAPSGVRFLDSFGSEIYFSGFGAPLGIGAATIDIINSYGNIYEVTIMVATGRVRVRPHPDKW
ncbi:MAG: prepilin-type N-terminal cleavage/methylation domain-containing protein [Clostridia bacterium]|nr:prepilin-type N-terminal cleavage/methylation domain-containing protein [Clostridia bacterium]